MAHWRNPRGNKKLPRDKWQWKDDDLRPKGCNENSSKTEVKTDAT